MNILRSSQVILSVLPATSSRLEQAVMGAHQLTLVFTLPAFTPLLIGDYVSFKGETYTLNQLPTVKKLSSTLFEYNCVFQGAVYELAKAAFLLPSPQGEGAGGEVEFSLTANATEFLQLIVHNLNRVAALSPSPQGEGWGEVAPLSPGRGAGGEVWFVGDVTGGQISDSVYKTLSFSSESCAEALSRLADEFETEYHVSGNTIHLVQTWRASPLQLQYGSTLYDLERVSVDSADILTRLYPFGSERNIAANYRNGSKRLLIPSPQGEGAGGEVYIEANTGVYGVIEGSKIFEDIYPRLSSGPAGAITGIGADIFTFTDSALDFDVNGQQIPGTPAKVRFLTGACAGYDLEIASYTNATKTFRVIANVDDKDFAIPNESIYPQVDDKYVLLDIAMPDSYVTAAEAELLAAAQTYLQENSHPKVNYRCTFSQLWHRANNPDIRVGDVVQVVDTQLGVNEPIRVVKISRSVVNDYDINIELANTVSKTTLQRINAEITKTETGIRTTNADMKKRFTNSYRNLAELRASVFDTDGYFDPANIKPLSIETSMLSVGAKSQTFQTDITFYPNYLGDADSFAWSAGAMVHFTIAESVLTWNLPAGSFTDLNAEPYYIYLKCDRATSAGEVFLSTSQIKFDENPGYYHFLVGLLHTPLTPPSGGGGAGGGGAVRGISLTYGQTTINGQFIRTGVISSIDGAVYFNLNTGEIVAGSAGQIRLNADGSGQLADGNIAWDEEGNVSMQGDFRGKITVSKTYGSVERSIEIGEDGNFASVKMFEGTDVVARIGWKDFGTLGVMPFMQMIKPGVQEMLVNAYEMAVKEWQTDEWVRVFTLDKNRIFSEKSVFTIDVPGLFSSGSAYVLENLPDYASANSGQLYKDTNGFVKVKP